MPEYKQCTTIGSFDSALMEFLYFLFVMVMSLILPFIIMLYSYLVIIWVISRSGHFQLYFFGSDQNLGGKHVIREITML